MKNLIFFLFAILIFTTHLTAQKKEVAGFGNEKITAEEYLKRFELTPRIRSSANIDTQKTHFLYTLLAEKLWAKEARKQNLDTLYSYKQYIYNLEKMLVRDALFKREIESKVSLSEKDIQHALSKNKYELQFKFLFSDSKDEIQSLYSKLSTTNIDSLLMGRSENTEQTEPVKVVFGQINEILEDTLYSLKINEYTKPIFNEIGWVIYYLVNKRELAASELGELQSAKNEVTKTLTNRQKQKLLNDYLDELLKYVNADTDGKLFQLLVNKLSEKLAERYKDQNEKIYYLYENDLIQLINSIDTKRKNEHFIKFETAPVTVKEFLYYIYFNNFKSTGTDLASVRTSLYGIVKDFISLEVVTREGYKQNLNLLHEIKEELKMWEDNFLAQYLRNTYNSQAKVSETQLNNYISEQVDSVVSTKFVSITEAILSSLEQAQQILTQLSYNYNFEDILKNMDFPQSSIYHSSEPEPLSNFGDIAGIIDNMKTGEVYGPVTRDGKYSILKLNYVEEKQLSAEDQNKLQVDTQKEILFYKNLRKILEEKTIEFAKKYKLDINQQVLNEIKVTEIPTLIYRYYGFGGQTVAAPFLNLFYDWYYQYKSEEQNPL